MENVKQIEKTVDVLVMGGCASKNAAALESWE